MANALFNIKLLGNFGVFSQDGSEIDLRDTRGKALLAILAASRDKKRSREWLQAVLWSRTGPEHAANSLRQTLYKLRQNLSDLPDLLNADSSHVWLSNVSVVDQSDETRCFFEDAPSKLGEAFEDWLRQERATYFQDQTTIITQPIATSSGMVIKETDRSQFKPCVLLAPPRAEIHSQELGGLATMLCNQIAEHLRLQGLVHVFDTRNIVADQLSPLASQGLNIADALIEIELSQFGSHLKISASARSPETHMIMWMASLEADQGSNFGLSRDQLMEFGNQVVDSVTMAVFERTETGKRLTQSGKVSLFAAVHQIMGHSTEGLGRAKLLLNQLCDGNPSGLSLAWRAFSASVDKGENCEFPDPAAMEEIRTDCRIALELEPSNSLVLSLVGHVNGFVLDDKMTGAECLSLAREISPYAPFAWDLSAMNALYRDQTKEGFDLANRANRLSRFSPYKPIYDSSLSISASLCGDHHQAVRIGRSILLRREAFLPVMRHMFASLSLSGQHDEARKMLEDITAIDPDFSAAKVGTQEYPLSSSSSVDLIRAGFQSLETSGV